MLTLGLLLADRLDPPDLGQARHWFEQAATAGDTDAMVKLGLLLADRLDPPDRGQARHWFEQAPPVTPAPCSPSGSCSRTGSIHRTWAKRATGSNKPPPPATP